MTVPELKPCPFCGGPAELIRPHDGARTYVMCVLHFCSGPQKTAEHAIAAWNRRANLPPTLEQAKALPEIKALVDAMRECADDLEAFTRAEYGWPNVHPAMQGKIDRDMQVVVNARAALRAIGEGGE